MNMTWRHAVVILGVLVACMFVYVKISDHSTILECYSRGTEDVSSQLYPAANLQGNLGNQSVLDVIKYMAYPPDTEQTLSHWLSSWQPEIKAELKQLVKDKTDQEDPKLIQHIRKVLVPPAKHKVLKFSRHPYNTPQATEAIKILGKKKNGFFIEAGALDGERSSNTIYLEDTYKWTGLLVEMDPYFFQQILGRNRNAYSINACLSPESHPITIAFKESTGGHGMLDQTKAVGDTSTSSACYPLFSILLAMNVTKVDFLSLDVEGFEMPILRSIPWKKIDISVIAVEYSHGNKPDYIKFMESQGYRTHKDIHYHNAEKVLYVDDFIFVKKSLK